MANSSDCQGRDVRVWVIDLRDRLTPHGYYRRIFRLTPTSAIRHHNVTR